MMKRLNKTRKRTPPREEEMMMMPKSLMAVRQSVLVCIPTTPMLPSIQEDMRVKHSRVQIKVMAMKKRRAMGISTSRRRRQWAGSTSRKQSKKSLVPLPIRGRP